MQKIKRSEKERRKQAEHELERYRNKVRNQQRMIDRLKEQIAGYQQSVDLSFAMVTAAVQQAGELTITQEELVHIVQAHCFAAVSYDAERMAYTLRAEVTEDGGEES